jgi:hypothetical protein
VSQQNNTYPYDANGGDTCRIQLKTPPRGRVTRLQVIQFSGPLDGFNFTLYNSAVCCPPGINGPGVDPGIEAGGQICPTRVAEPGDDRYLVGGGYPNPAGLDGGFFGYGVYYINGDAVDSNARPALYLKLDVGGAGPKVFGIYLTVDTHE